MHSTEFPELTGSLEDYLETIYELVRDQKLARVRDIAKARGVRAASVTPAMRRLAHLGFINYLQREYIDLTPKGERAARRIFARHQVLTRFFHEILGMEPTASESDACAMEHSISKEGMDSFVRFFEFLGVCPDGALFIKKFHSCAARHATSGKQLTCTLDGADSNRCQFSSSAFHASDKRCHQEKKSIKNLADLKAGQRARVSHVNGSGAIRQRLLDMGILPNTDVSVERIALAGDPIWIKLQGFQLALRRKEAESVAVIVD